MPLFSICIPNYNYAHYIGETIQSVLDQSCQDFEIIVADNASTDHSVEVVESYRAKSDKIRLIKNRYNIGFGPNLQRATETAAGDFMLLLSSDDLMLPGALDAYKTVIDHGGANAHHTVFCTAVVVVDSAGQRAPDQRLSLPDWSALDVVQEEINGLPCRTARGQDLMALSLRWISNPLPFLSTLYPRALYEAIEGYNTTWVRDPDFHFVLKLLSQRPTVICIDREFFGYRVHSTNQAAQENARASLTAEFDRYQMVLQYNAKIAAEFGVDHEDMLRVLVEGICLKRAGRSLAQGQWRLAFRRFCLAWALYPDVAVKSPLMYGMAGLLLLGPIGGWIFRVLQRRRGERLTEPGP